MGHPPVRSRLQFEMGQTGMREGGMYSRTGFQERSQDVVAWTVKRNGPEKSRTICIKLWRSVHGDGVDFGDASTLRGHGNRHDGRGPWPAEREGLLA